VKFFLHKKILEDYLRQQSVIFHIERRVPDVLPRPDKRDDRHQSLFVKAICPLNDVLAAQIVRR
jgi:hypothetical protein